MENLQFIHSSLDYTHAQTISTLSIHTYSILLEVNPAAATHSTHSYKEAVKVLTRAWDNKHKKAAKHHLLDPWLSSKVVEAVIRELMRVARLVHVGAP